MLGIEFWGFVLKLSTLPPRKRIQRRKYTGRFQLHVLQIGKLLQNCSLPAHITVRRFSRARYFVSMDCVDRYRVLCTLEHSSHAAKYSMMIASVLPTFTLALFASPSPVVKESRHQFSASPADTSTPRPRAFKTPCALPARLVDAR